VFYTIFQLERVENKIQLGDSMPQFILKGELNKETSTLEIKAENADQLHIICLQLIKDAKSFYLDECLAHNILIKLL